MNCPLVRWCTCYIKPITFPRNHETYHNIYRIPHYGSDCGLKIIRVMECFKIHVNAVRSFHRDKIYCGYLSSTNELGTSP